MMNEFVYCPRLFYYEHMEGVFAESADTQRGSALHDKVDRGRGALKKQRAQTKDEQALEEQALERRSADEAPPDDSATSPTPEKIIHSRLATLGSERLGVVAKLDLIEVRVAAELSEDLFSRSEVQRVTPVEYKVGAPREGAEGIELWPTDQMQLGLQILILRDNGYTCDEGVLYCHATRQRVRLAMTTELEAWILREIAAARLWRSPMTYHRPCKAPPSACAAHSHQFAYQMRRW
jgi:CRISPR-associated protein Cas1